VSRFARGADDERISRRAGGGDTDGETDNGLSGGVFSLSESSMRIFDIRVVRKLR
jgi:hypothetical protein